MKTSKKLFLLAVFLIIFNSGQARAEDLFASWYSIQSLKDEGTFRYSKGIMANGKPFKDSNFTCACRLYPLGSTLLITNLSNNKTVKVLVTDRISKRFAKTRIDLSISAFREIENLSKGITKIKVKEVK